MMASGFVHKSRIGSLFLVPGGAPRVASLVIGVAYPFPLVVVGPIEAAITLSCGWEDEDDLSVDPEDLLDSGYGSLDDLEKLGGEDEGDEYDEDELDDYYDEDNHDEEYDDYEDDDDEANS